MEGAFLYRLSKPVYRLLLSAKQQGRFFEWLLVIYYDDNGNRSLFYGRI